MGKHRVTPVSQIGQTASGGFAHAVRGISHLIRIGVGEDQVTQITPFNFLTALESTWERIWPIAMPFSRFNRSEVLMP